MQSERKHEREILIFQDRLAAGIALCRAAKTGDLTEIQQWLELDPSLINNPFINLTPLAWALDAPHPDVFIYLLSNDADVMAGYRGYTLAERIALRCQWQPTEKEAARQALAEQGISLNPFLLAAWRGGTKALSQEALFVRDGPCNNVAHYASANGQLALLKQLHTMRPELMVSSNQFGTTPLLFAALNGQLPVVQWLLQEGGAEAKEHDYLGYTALTLAAQHKHANVVNWLIGEFGMDPGDGMEIAWQLGAHGEAQVQKARELKALFHNYYAKQKLLLNERALAASLPSNFPKVLRGIVAEYTGPTDEEKQYLREKLAAQNDNLLKQLRAHATSSNPFLKWRSLSQELIAQLASQRLCNALTIHDAVSKFLTIHRSKIAGSELATILQNILDETAYFEAANPPASQPSKEITFAPAASTRWWSRIINYFKSLMSGGVIAPQEDKPANTKQLPPQGPLSPPPSSSPTPKETVENTARTTRLIEWLTRLPDPHLGSVNWQPSREGQAIAYFDHEAQAQDVMALLRNQQPELILQSGSQSSSGSPAIHYTLSVAAPDGVTLVLPVVAANDVPVSPLALSSASAFFAQDETSSVPTAKREKKIQAEAEQTTASTRRDSLHANPLLEEEKNSRNSL